MTIKIIIIILGVLLLIISALPLIKNDNWIFRLSEFPRGQKLYLSVIIIILYGIFYFNYTSFDYLFISLSSINVIYLFALIFPYTPFAKKQMIRSNGSLSNRTLKLFICNVFQPNDKYHKLEKLIRKYEPDLVLVAEADSKWEKGLQSIERDFPFLVKQSQDNTYGMILYSKLELIEPEIRFLVDKEIPSIHTFIKLNDEDVFKLFFVHPMPPVPSENTRSTERDKELLIVGKKAERLKIPCIVAGDLNDVAWSYTTKLFLKISKLLDPRRGRGFFNTFHAKIPFIRVPLDHVFCSAEWQLIRLERTAAFNSDHFPIYIELALKPHQKYEHELFEPDKEDKREAHEKINTRTNKGGENK